VKKLALGLGVLLAAWTATQVTTVQFGVPAVPAQWAGGAWSGGTGGGVTALPGGGFTFPAGQILAPDGSAAAPSYSFANDPDTGMSWGAANTTVFSSLGFGSMAIGASFITLAAPRSLGWAPAGDVTAVPDVYLSRGAADILSLRGSGGGASLNFAARPAPATPAAGAGLLYYSSVDKKFHQINDAGLDTALW
jgi:hypothetical protein